MSENPLKSACTRAEFMAAQKAGIWVMTTEDEQAVHAFAEAIREEQRARIAPDISCQRLKYLAERLRDDKPVTKRLVEQARSEFEACIARIPDYPAGHIASAITTTQIAWELGDAA